MRPLISITAIAAIAAITMSACSTDRSTDTAADQLLGAVDGMDDSVVHIHGLGVDPADGTLYVATHFGLFRVDPATGESSRVANRYQDTMAFTITGPGRFLASGHPDLREDLPPHLGLIESTDAGNTWQPLARQGEADFHILEPAGDSLYAYDALTGSLLRTEDYTTFDEVLQAPLVSLTATGTPSSSTPSSSPSSQSAQADGDLLATTGDGRLLLIDPDSGQTADVEAPALRYLDSTTDGELVGIGPQGQVYVALGRGSLWDERGTIDGQPAALTITEQSWFAATQDTVLRSDDQGTTWTRVLPSPGSA